MHKDQTVIRSCQGQREGKEKGNSIYLASLESPFQVLHQIVSAQARDSRGSSRVSGPVVFSA